MTKQPKARPQPAGLADAAPFPSLLPRRISDKQSHDWGLDEVAAKIPEGVCVMICGTATRPDRGAE